MHTLAPRVIPRVGRGSGPSVCRVGVGSGWVIKFSVLVGSGPMSKIFNKYAIYMQEIRRL